MSGRGATVVVVSGHMVDAPGRRRPRFPAALVPRVAVVLTAALRELAPVCVYASAARGADLLSLEAALADGVAAHVVLPCPAARFAELSVDMHAPEQPPGQPEGDWRQRFLAVLRGARAAETLSSGLRAPDVLDYELTNRVLLGLALADARARSLPALVLALWDGRAGDGPGGTAAMLALARAHGVPAMVMDLEHLREGEVARWPQTAGPIGTRLPEPGRSVAARGSRRIAHLVVRPEALGAPAEGWPLHWHADGEPAEPASGDGVHCTHSPATAATLARVLCRTAPGPVLLHAAVLDRGDRHLEPDCAAMLVGAAARLAAPPALPGCWATSGHAALAVLARPDDALRWRPCTGLYRWLPEHQAGRDQPCG